MPQPSISLESLPLEVGLEHLRAGRLDDAAKSLRAALAREPGRFAAVRGLATAHVLRGDLRAAREVVGQFTADHPMVPEGWRLASQLEWKLGARERAMEMLQTGLKRLPGSAVLQRQLEVFMAASAAGALTGGSFPDAANPPVRAPAALERDPDWLDQIAADPILLGAILSSLDDATSATPASRDMLSTLERRMTALLSQQSAHADRQLLLAKVRLMLNDLDGAMAAIEPALKVNPRLIPAHRLIARIQAKKGNTHQALATLHQLIKQGLAWPDLHYQIAELEHQIGASANARSHLYSAVRLNPQFHDAKALLERMAA